ncbi:MAG TPA: glycosyl hydrolase [Gemmatimonadaceae bacterium]|nr:glycosyl hydrolase [Gemmatimonadaceae bacterium]
MPSSRSTRALLAALLIPGVVAAQGRRGGRGATAADTAALLDVTWRNIGPEASGRIVAVAGSDSRPNEYYFGTTGGGVWKTTDGGKTTAPMTDKYFGGTIGAIAIDEKNPDVVWVGGGEYPIRGNVSYGDGVWKTTDGGKTWTSLGLRETQQISRIRIDPRNPDVAYVAALGHVWAPNPERGVFKTTDGGRTWRKVLFRNDSTGAIELQMDPSNPDILYAALWQAGRKPWLLISGGTGGGIFKSTDAGEHWTEITHNTGLPSGLIGNVGMAISPAKPSRIWALIENEPGGGVYRSDDAGATWTLLNQARDIRQRAWYFGRVFADPRDTNVVYSLNVGTFISRDGGKTFSQAPIRGGSDHHDLWIAPNDPKRMAIAYDQGVGFTTDGGQLMTSPNTPTGQFYHVHLLNKAVFDVCGAKQDAGSQCGPVRQAAGFGGRGGGGGGGGRGGAAIPRPYSEFYPAAGGESGYMASDPTDPNVTYGGNYSGVIDMQNRATGERARLDPWPLNPMGHDARDSKYRFQWTFPIMNSPHDPNVLYVGSNVVFKSSDKGRTWHIISPDLTKHDPATLGASGGPISKDQTSIEYYATVFALQESPITPGLIWAGSDDGLIHVTRDGGKTWKDVTPKGLAPWTRISIIDPSPHDPGTAWVAANRYQLDDYAPYLYRTTDYGATWTRINAGIPNGEYTRSIREDLVKPGLVYASTERGMWMSRDAGAHWESLRKNLPPVPVHDIALRDDDMVIATHGRAFWVMENLALLRQQPEADAATAAGKDFLYTPAPAYRATGATIQYRVAQENQPVTIELLDPAGKLIRKYSSTDTVATPAGRGGGGGRGGFGAQQRVTNRPGVNRYTWNLQYPDATTFRNMILWQGSTAGPFAAPGTYGVRVIVGNDAPLAEKLVVRMDPQSKATNADLAEQLRFGLQVRDSVSAANEAIRVIRNVKHQLEDRASKMSGTAGSASFGAMAKQFEDELSNVEDSIYQTKNQSGEDPLNFPIRINNQLAALLGFVTAGERHPPPQSYDVFKVLAPKFQTEDTRYKRLIKVDLAKINAALKAAGQPEIVPSDAEVVGERREGIS